MLQYPLYVDVCATPAATAAVAVSSLGVILVDCLGCYLLRGIFNEKGSFGKDPLGDTVFRGVICRLLQKCEQQACIYAPTRHLSHTSKYIHTVSW